MGKRNIFREQDWLNDRVRELKKVVDTMPYCSVISSKAQKRRQTFALKIAARIAVRAHTAIILGKGRKQ